MTTYVGTVVILFCLPFRDSVRVDGVGAASITEVSFQELSITSEEEANKMDPDTEVSKLQEELASLKQRKSELQQKKTRTESQQQLMDNYCQSLIDSSKSAGTGTLLSSKTIGMACG